MRMIDAIRAYFYCRRLKRKRMERLEERLAEIRARFPRPVGFTKERYATSDAYCVGGSLCLYDKPHLRGVAEWRFLAVKVLASVRQDHNPYLSAVRAWYYARRLITANDRSNFERAWAWAARALAYHVPIRGSQGHGAAAGHRSAPGEDLPPERCRAVSHDGRGTTQAHGAVWRQPGMTRREHVLHIVWESFEEHGSPDKYKDLMDFTHSLAHSFGLDDVTTVYVELEIQARFKAKYGEDWRGEYR
jgi:hypothetical protein